MKANEVPEKLYLLPNGLISYCRNTDEDVEYACTDAFIEKALKWYCRDCECNDNCDANHKCAFRDFFEMYLKGNEKALPPKISNAINPDGSTTENYRYRHFIERMQDNFVDKACEWLKNNVSNYAFVDTDRIGNVADIDLSLVQDFRKYMKGE